MNIKFFYIYNKDKNMKYLKKISEVFVYGPGGYLNDKSSLSDKTNYKINELKWISETLESKKDHIDDNMLSEIAECINKMHDIINKIK